MLVCFPPITKTAVQSLLPSPMHVLHSSIPPYLHPSCLSQTPSMPRIPIPAPLPSNRAGELCKNKKKKSYDLRHPNGETLTPCSPVLYLSSRHLHGFCSHYKVHPLSAERLTKPMPELQVLNVEKCHCPPRTFFFPVSSKNSLVIQIVTVFPCLGIFE